MKVMFYLIGIMLLSFSMVYGEEEVKMQNVFENIPYHDADLVRKELVSSKDLLLMQVALKPEQSVPQHNANSNVHILVVKGEVVITLDGKDVVAKEGALVPVAFKTPMSVTNKSQGNASFLIIKTPNPSQMAEKIQK